MRPQYRAFLALLITFALGIAAASMLQTSSVFAFSEFPTGTNPPSRASPSDTIKESDIFVYKNGVMVNFQDEDDNKWLISFNLSDPTWSRFLDTKSMEPVLDKNTNAVRIKVPCEDIHVGDIITYKHAEQGLIIHRVVHKDNDEQGRYFVLKGDNNPTNDPGRVRCEQVQGKLVAIFY